MSKVDDLKIFNDNIFILDVKEGLFKFDKEGKFIYQIGKIGNGPGEYGMVFYFSIIEKSNEIMLYCYPGGRVNVYSLETGIYKRNFNPCFDTSGFVEFSSGLIAFFVPQSGKQITDNEIYICNSEGQINDSIPDSRLPRISGKHATAIPVYYPNNKSVYYMDGFQDTLVFLSEDVKKKPYLKLGLVLLY